MMMSDGVADANIGTVLGGRWRIERLLAAGGMGAVYRAREIATGRSVALKLIKTARAREPALIARFRRETAALAAVQHPNIVAFLDGAGTGTDGAAPDGGEGALYLVMELLQGRSLRGVLALEPTRQLEWQRVLRIGCDICRALEALHAAGIVHRDLKPDNVMLVDEHDGERAKLIDLGIVRLDESASDTGLLAVTSVSTRADVVVGTPGYISPEQLRGRPATATSDIYALGVILFELITGRMPYDASNADTAAIEALLEEQLRRPALDACALLPWLPPAVGALLARMLERDPGRRVATARDALALIERTLATDADLAPDARTEMALSSPPPAPTPATPAPWTSAAAGSATLTERVVAEAAARERQERREQQQQQQQQARRGERKPLSPGAVAGIAAAAFAFVMLVAGVAAFMLQQRVARQRALAVAAAEAHMRQLEEQRRQAAEQQRAAASAAAAPLPSLHVSSAPPGADVFVDDTRRGQTPLALTDLTPGAHVVRIVGAAGGEDVHTVDVVAGGAPLTLHAKLPGISRSAVRALVKRRAADLESCGARDGLGALTLQAQVTVFPSGRVQLIAKPAGTRAACLAALAARDWRVDPFTGEAVTVTLDVVTGAD